MSTNCTNTGSCGLSLYLRVCCVISNIEEAVIIRKPDINAYSLCSIEQPKICPSGTAVIQNIFLIIDTVRTWF